MANFHLIRWGEDDWELGQPITRSRFCRGRSLSLLITDVFPRTWGLGMLKAHSAVFLWTKPAGPLAYLSLPPPPLRLVLIFALDWIISLKLTFYDCVYIAFWKVFIFVSKILSELCCTKKLMKNYLGNVGELCTQSQR